MVLLADRPKSQLTAQQQKNLVWKAVEETSSGHGRISSLFKGRKGRVEEPSKKHKAMDKLEKSGKKAAPFTKKK
jgi:hypothetical protein